MYIYILGCSVSRRWPIHPTVKRNYVHYRANFWGVPNGHRVTYIMTGSYGYSLVMSKESHFPHLYIHYNTLYIWAIR